MTLLLLAHGWGFDRQVWARLAGSLVALAGSNDDELSLAQEAGARSGAAVVPGWVPAMTGEMVASDDIALFDLGYFGEPIIPKIEPARPIVAVGHSFGAAWLLRFCAEHALCLKGFIAINGFPRLTEAPDYAPATPPRMVERMRRRFTDEPQKVLADFRQRCGLPEAPASVPDPTRLEEGLDQLAAWDLRPQLRSLNCPVLSLVSENDQIVPRVMAVHAFEGAMDLRMAWHPTAGHVLPIEAPEWCAGHIKSFLARL